MKALVVVENVRRLPLRLPGVELVSAKEYLTDPVFSELRGTTVYNLCRYYSYQSMGYYVSLLAAARGHRPLPSVATMQDLRLAPLLRIVSEDLEELIQKSLSPLKSPGFELSIYFGRNVTRRYDRLSQALFNQFPAPFLRAVFRHDDEWALDSIRPIATAEIPDTHLDFVIEQTTRYFSKPVHRSRPRQEYRYDLAILYDPEEVDKPSNDRAIQKFIRAGQQLGIEVTVIDKDDYGRIAEFDALFIRQTTSVTHHTFRFARRALAEGLVVIDDPESILRCGNKAYQAELFARHDIATPKTKLVHTDGIDEVERDIGLPCVLKKPDAAFSQGVVKVDTPDELRLHLKRFLEDSDLVIAQEFVPSAFDWRIGVLDGRPLFACRYHMARGHWQIVERDARGTRRYGKVEAVDLSAVPARGLKLGVKAARLIGGGLYGVDLKQLGRHWVVMEVNDNPNIDAGFDDAILKDELYAAVMRYFRERLDRRGAKGASA